MNQFNPDQDDKEIEAPPVLRRALKVLQKEHLLVPPEIDEAILGAAREHLETIPRKRQRFAGPAWWSAIAASFVLLAWLAYSVFRFNTPPDRLADDFNADGTVDVLDALALARQIEQSTPTPPANDVNGDGVVDRRDADSLALKIVRLKEDDRS